MGVVHQNLSLVQAEVDIVWVCKCKSIELVMVATRQGILISIIEFTSLAKIYLNDLVLYIERSGYTTCVQSIKEGNIVYTSKVVFCASGKLSNGPTKVVKKTL